MGEVSSRKLTEVIEIFEGDKVLLILPQGGDLLGINSKSTSSLEFVNASTSSKWDVSQTYSASEPVGSMLVNLTIDRQTGLFSYKLLSGRGKREVSATGSCEKVSQQQSRKF